MAPPLRGSAQLDEREVLRLSALLVEWIGELLVVIIVRGHKPDVIQLKDHDKNYYS